MKSHKLETWELLKRRIITNADIEEHLKDFENVREIATTYDKNQLRCFVGNYLLLDSFVAIALAVSHNEKVIPLHAVVADLDDCESEANALVEKIAKMFLPKETSC